MNFIALEDTFRSLKRTSFKHKLFYEKIPMNCEGWHMIFNVNLLRVSTLSFTTDEAYLGGVRKNSSPVQLFFKFVAYWK